MSDIDERELETQIHMSIFEKLDSVLKETRPARPAETMLDHEEWARFYLGLLTNSAYQSVRSAMSWTLVNKVWTDNELIALARQHAEAARILKGLSDLHER